MKHIGKKRPWVRNGTTHNTTHNDSLEYILLTPQNFESYQQQIMQSERVFGESIRMGWDEYRAILSEERAIGIVAVIDGQYVGNVIGGVPDYEERAEYDLTGQQDDFIYIYNLVIDNPKKDKTLKAASIPLLKKFGEEARTKGYKRVFAHYDPDVSLKIAKHFGAKPIYEHPNWQDTGKTYTLCEKVLE